MHKLFRLREWWALPEAAQHLSATIGRPVSEADVLQMGLDDRLRLTVKFGINAEARIGSVVPIDQAAVRHLSNDSVGSVGANSVGRLCLLARPSAEELLKGLSEGKTFEAVIGFPIDNPPTRILQLGKNRRTICGGLYDLPMIGDEVVLIEEALHQLIGGPDIRGFTDIGVLVALPDGTIAQLQELIASQEREVFEAKLLAKDERFPPDFAAALVALGGRLHQCELTEAEQQARDVGSYMPATEFPPDAMLVVRTSALAQLMERVSSAEPAAGTSPDRALADIQQAYDEIYAESDKAPSQRAVAARANYARETVRARWPQVKKAAQPK